MREEGTEGAGGGMLASLGGERGSFYLIASKKQVCWLPMKNKEKV